MPLFRRRYSYLFSVDIDVLRFVFSGKMLIFEFNCLLLYGDHLVDIMVVEDRYENVLMTFRKEYPLD